MSSFVNTPTGRPFRDLADELHQASAAFRADAIHRRMTGATVVLEGDAADGLADLLMLAATAVTLLIGGKA